MSALIEPVLVFLLLANLVLLGSSRLALYIRTLALQGLALALLPLLLAGSEGFTVRAGLLAAGSLLFKGIVIPRLLSRTLQAAGVRHEVDPSVGYATSLLVGVLTLGLSLWLGARLSPPLPVFSPLLLPTALCAALTGLFLIVSRQKALTQVMGYLGMENGIYLFGLAVARDEPFVVELGVLLDLLVGVFVMGIAIFHISREFDHIDVDQLSALKD
jgi:hydrogenase-4 component E